MPIDFRCDCPFTSSLDVLGDKWMLVLIKLMLIEEKKTFKDFTTSEEAIATNILAAKLKLLEEMGLVIKMQKPNNKKVYYYILTEKALDLAPVLVELAFWSDQHLRNLHPTLANGENMQLLRKDPRAFAQVLIDQYKKKNAGGLIFI